MNTGAKPKNRILIAEDDPVSRRLLHSFLVKWGFEVVVAEDGAEALRLLERLDFPRLAILDWMMPGLEGPQVCERIRKETNRAYVYFLLLTARSQKEDLLKGLQSGADDYLTKPFDSQELRARLQVGQRILDLQDHLIEAREELLYQATHDVLTRISNRGVILDAVTRELSRQEREGGKFGVVLGDLDHFKFVNDRFGHLAGDAVLQEAARRMAATIRPYDMVGRYGGEEFLIVAPSADVQGTLALAERIRNAIESQSVRTDAGDVSMTMSLGVAISEPARPVDAKQLIQAADEALYRAKERGRNRCELAEPGDFAGALPATVENVPVKSGAK